MVIGQTQVRTMKYDAMIVQGEMLLHQSSRVISSIFRLLTVCVFSLHGCSHCSSRCSGFLPTIKNILIGGKDAQNCP